MMRMMRAKLIKEITELYPPDDNNEGRELLMLALCESWRELPVPVLAVLHHMCVRKERSDHDNMRRG